MAAIVAAALLSSFTASLVLTGLVRHVARRIGFLDKPGGHKEHDRPVALGGGVAIFLTVALAMLAGVLVARGLLAGGHSDWVPAALRPHLSGLAGKLSAVLAILAGGLVLHVLGLIDDIRPLGFKLKLAVQVAVALALSGGLGVRAAEALGPWPSTALTVLWLVLIINAFNFLDNIDGLSAGVAAIAAGVFACAAMRSGQVFVPCLAWVLTGAALGFLVYNFPPASVFMGDAGSMVIGYFLGLLTVLTTYWDPDQQLRPAGLLVPLLVLAVPLYDVVSVVLIRLRAGDSPFRGDRRHFSHRLVRRGLSVRAAVLTIYLATAATSLSAVVLPRADWPIAMVVLAQSLCIVLIIAILEQTRSPG